MPEPTLKPTPLAPALADDPTPRAPASPFARHRGGLRWLVLSVALALAAGVLLPDFLQGPQPATQALANGAAQAPTINAEPADPILGPEAKAAARLDAQQGLAIVLKASDALATRKPEGWNATAWRAAQTRIADGERTYREERYPAAIRIYREAGQQLATLEASLPGLIAARRKVAQAAFERGDSPAASRDFKGVLALAPGDPGATQGLKRAEAYARVQALLAQASGYQRMDDVVQARGAYAAALALDPASSAATEGLARLQESDSNDAYAAAMSRGYEALGAARYDEARSAFERALKLDRTTVAKKALADAVERATVAKIEAALANAGRAESAERWDEAARALSSALAVEAGLKDLRPRLERAKSRAALARRINEALKDPGFLRGTGADPLIDEARRINNPGPRHRSLLRALDEAIKSARAPAN